jgi:transcription-repair coupling factor (superfamily II helicase)
MRCCWPAWPSATRPVQPHAPPSSRPTPPMRSASSKRWLFLRPPCAARCFPTGKPCPTTTFSPHQDLISERLATLWRISQKDAAQGADVVLVPATTALYRLAPPVLPGGLHLPLQGQAKARRGASCKAQLTLAGYQPRLAGGQPGRVRRARRADRPVPDGLSACRSAWICSTTKSTASAPSTPTASAACTPCPRCACCPAASSPWTTRRARKLPQPLARDAGGRPDASSRIYKDMGNGRGHGGYRVLPATVL